MTILAYSPDQPRADDGKFGEGPGSGGSGDKGKGKSKGAGVVEEGKHVKELYVKNVPAKEVKSILQGAAKPEIKEQLAAHPLNVLSVTDGKGGAFEKGLGGYYNARADGRGSVVINANPLVVDAELGKGKIGGRPFGYGYADAEPAHIAYMAKNKDEFKQRVLTHEIGHHMHGGDTHPDPTADAIVQKAFKEGKPVSEYGRKNPSEYFAESYSAYHYHRDDLKMHDPVGYQMVEDVAAYRLGKGKTSRAIGVTTATFDLRALEPAAVERGPGGAPVAFRIWPAGKTMTDKGPQFFTERSAALLMAEQTARQNLFSIDVDHLSLNEVAPPEARKAVGWHKLAVRRDASGAPELWAVEAEWTDVASQGLAKEPPEWRYFSPAYQVDPKTREVVSYLNTALTNIPATWGVTALASSPQRGSVVMTKREMIAMFKKMSEGDSPEAKACGLVVSMLESGTMPSEEPDGDEPPPHEEPDGDEANRPAPAAPPAETSRAASRTPAAPGVDPELGKLLARVQELETREAKRLEDDERAKLMATRPDLKGAVRAVVEKLPLAHIKELLPTLPKGPEVDPAAAAQATATRGAGQSNTERGVRSSPEQKASIDARMGLAAKGPAIKREGNHVLFGVMTPKEAQTELAKRENAQGGSQ